MYSLSYISEAMAKLFGSDLESSKQLLQKFINEPVRLFNLLVRCPEERMRICVMNAIFAAFDRVSSNNKDLKENDPNFLKLPFDLLNVLMSIVGYELATQWVKFKQFFELFKNVVLQGGDLMAKYCLEKDLITLLLDFFLEKSSPVSTSSTKRYEMGNPSQSPDFGFLLEIVAFLVTRSDLSATNNNAKENVIDNKKLIPLSPSALKCIQCEELVPKYIKSGGNFAQISKMVAFTCLNNKKFSKKMCTMTLKGVNDYEVKNIPQYFDLIAELFALEDQYQPLRIEWILGYAQPNHKAEYGLAGQIDIEDEINMYISGIGSEHRDEPLLQLLWNYRKRYELLITQCLKMLFTVACKNDFLYNYLKNVAPPSYIYKRYIDWIPRFLDTYSKTNSFMTSSELKCKDSLILEVRDLIKIMETRIDSEKLQPPQFYMVGKTLATRELKHKEVSTKGAKVTVTELTVEVYENTKPMGEYNLGLSGDYLIKHFGHIRMNVNSKYEAKLALEQESQKPPAAAASAPQKETQNEIKTETPHAPKIVIHLTNPGPEQKGDSSAASNVRSEILESETMKIAEPETKNTPEVRKEEPAAPPTVPENSPISAEPRIQVSVQKSEDKTPPTADIKDTQPAAFAGKQAQEVTKVIDEEKLFKALPVIHKIEVTGVGYYTGYAKVVIKHKEGVKPNFYCPLSRLKCRVTAFSSIILLIQANDCTLPISDYEILLSTAEVPEQNHGYSSNESHSTVKNILPTPVPAVFVPQPTSIHEEPESICIFILLREK